jgi:hypothetical protein
MMRAARLLIVVAAVLAAAPTSASATGASTAVVVIDTGASVRSAVIHFDGSINGIDALELAGGNPTTYGFSGNGAAVCSIDGVGNPANESCLIGPNGEYWAYYLATGGATSWTYARGCACTTTVNDGDVQGWRYGTGAAPRSSADFCAYVACAPPPTTATTAPAPGPGVGPVTTVPYQPPVAPSSQPAGTSPQSGGSGTTASGPAITGAEPGSIEATTTSTPPPTTTTTKGSRDRKDVQVAAAAVHRKAGGGTVAGDSTGSPTGVAIAAGALAATAGIAVWLRRRRSALR